nr:hypothetical protein [Tanacetum cinerariifolium]
MYNLTDTKNNIPNDSSNNSLLEEADLFLFDNLIPLGIENVADDPEGDIRLLEELLIDDSILSHESSDFNFEDNPSNPRPPPEPPDAEIDAGEEILVMVNDKDKFDKDYHFFMFDKVFALLSVESEDTVFNPGLNSILSVLSLISVRGVLPMGLKDCARWVKGHRHMVLLGEGYGTVPVGAGVREGCREEDG